MEDVEVVVVGAGLAGLRCAAELARRGREVLVLEASDGVGGRVRTDEVDGFLVDRGFQLLNPSYPAVRRDVDVDALELQTFEAGVAARTDDGLARLGHPLAAPGLLPRTLASVASRPREVLALVRWAAPLLRHPASAGLLSTLTRGADRDRAASLDDVGLDGLLRRVLDAFLAGVVLEDDGSTSHQFALLLVRSFVAGTPGLPRRGMRALPEQLAAPLGDRVRLGSAVDRLETGAGDVVVHASSGSVRARQVVVATAAPEAAGLAPDLGPASTRGVTTWWFEAPEAPTASRLLHVDARERPTGPLVNTAVVSNAAPSYAPRGSHLVEASTLLGEGRPAPEESQVRAHAGELLGAPTRDWRLVARRDVPHALPAQPAPLAARRPQRVGDHVVVCGDHRDTASIQGALVSGARAADAVAAGLAGSAGSATADQR